MAITSELIGSLSAPGYGFLTEPRGIYALPKYRTSITILVARWSGSGNISYDILDRETGSVVQEVRSSSYAAWEEFISPEVVSTLGKGALIRFNNSTTFQAYIVPNARQAPPVWNG